MGVTKSEHFTRKQNRMAELAKAWAHPARVMILLHLARNGSCICNDLVDVLPLSQSTVSQHLKELKRIGLIHGDIDPPKVCYCIDLKTWREMREVFESVFAGLHEEKCHC
jgi:predicted transcriptional regulator